MTAPAFSPLLRALNPIETALYNNDISALRVALLPPIRVAEIRESAFFYSSIFESSRVPPKNLQDFSKILQTLERAGIILHWEDVFGCYARSVNSAEGKDLIESVFLSNCSKEAPYKVIDPESRTGLRRIMHSLCAKITPTESGFPTHRNKENFLALLSALNSGFACGAIDFDSWVECKTTLLAPALLHGLIGSQELENDYASSLAMFREQATTTAATASAGAASGDSASAQRRPRSHSDIDLGRLEIIRAANPSEKLIANYVAPQIRAPIPFKREDLLNYRLREAYVMSRKPRSSSLRQEWEFCNFAKLPSLAAYEMEDFTIASFGTGIACEPHVAAPALERAPSSGSLFVSSPSPSPSPDGAQDAEAATAGTAVSAAHATPFSPIQTQRNVRK